MDCIFERVFVETPVDTDEDGKYDLIAVYVKRPKSTLSGEKVPVVYVANPYMLSCNEDWYVAHNVDQELKAFSQQNISEEEIKFDFQQQKKVRICEERLTQGYAETSIIDENIQLECISEVYDHFNERGYASVFSGGLGTRGSEGFTLTGSREEILAFKAVIDWLGGRCRAFTNKTDNIEIKASWSTGNVAMSAKSYLGTMCIGVATTGVEGLKTIIPEAAISNWYDYYRCNGLNLPALGWQGDDLDILAKYCFSRAKDQDDYEKIKTAYEEKSKLLLTLEDRESGNYNRFWDERNYLNLVHQIKASVLIIHGINDWNVKTNQCFPFFQALEQHQISRKMLIHQGEHIYIYNLRNSDTVDILDRWLDHYLKGIDNGIELEDKVLVESNLDQTQWHRTDTWPPSTVKNVNFPVNVQGRGVIIDDLSKTVYDSKKNNLKEWLDQLVLRDKSDQPNRVKYEWKVFDDIDTSGKDLRIAGTCRISFQAVIDQPTAILSAMVVDLGEDRRLTSEEIKGEDNLFAFGVENQPSAYKVITRGWLNGQNRSCLWSKEELIPGKVYDYRFDMVPTDYTLKNGHRLALIIYGIDAEATMRPQTVTTITLKQETIQAQIPYTTV